VGGSDRQDTRIVDLTRSTAIIRGLPYAGGWPFGDEKRCLEGTRQEFLDYIFKWVENPESERTLVVLGQAGTGKSSIAHEVARRVEKAYLGSYFAFRRGEGSKGKAYQLFTTLACDLSNRNPAFKFALGKVIKGNLSLRNTRDYRTLFECLLLEPLKNMTFDDPILIVVDALDESGDSIDKKGLHTFLARHLSELPLNFRILITSRPENGIELAFANALSVRTLSINDAKLAKTEQDIAVYLRSELPPAVFEAHGDKLTKAAEGVFQWAAVACGFMNSSASLGLSRIQRVERLLGHTRGQTGQGLLDNVYEEVLKEYFKSPEAQGIFRSVMGQLLAAVQPFSINSLITLRCYASKDDSDDSDLVLEILSYLGSLLSNVTSSDRTQPIIPLHTSFYDFLTNKESRVFYADLDDAHHQLAHSCLGLMLDKLKFNICELETSHLANTDVPDVESRIVKHVPPALSYACVYWDRHLERLAFERDLFTKLRFLFEEKFLFWLEVLSVKNNVGIALPALSSLLLWLQREVSVSHDSIGHVLTFA
jgi:NACHT domain